MSHIQPNKSQAVLVLPMPAPPCAPISPKLFFLLSSTQIMPNKTPLLQIQSSAKSSCLLYHTSKDEPIFSHPLSIPFLSHLPPFSPSSVITSTVFSPFSVLFHLSPRRHTCLRLRCCLLETQSLTHSVTSFTFPGQCYMFCEERVYVTLHLFGLYEAPVCVCFQVVCFLQQKSVKKRMYTILLVDKTALALLGFVFLSTICDFSEQFMQD